MSLLPPTDRAQLREHFAGLKDKVTLTLASDDLQLRLLFDEIVETGGDKLALVKLDLDRNPEECAAAGIDRQPAIALASPRAKGRLLFWGLPLGYEMATLVAAIGDLGGLDEGAPVTDTTQRVLDALDQDVHIHVFSTPG